MLWGCKLTPFALQVTLIHAVFHSFGKERDRKRKTQKFRDTSGWNTCRNCNNFIKNLCPGQWGSVGWSVIPWTDRPQVWPLVWVRGACGRQPIDVSPSRRRFSFPLSLNNKNEKKKKKKKPTTMVLLWDYPRIFFYPWHFYLTFKKSLK